MGCIAEGEGDEVAIEARGETAYIERRGWRLARGWGAQPDELFEAWNGLWEGALLAHDRHLRLIVVAREDIGDDATRWEIRPR